MCGSSSDGGSRSARGRGGAGTMLSAAVRRPILKEKAGTGVKHTLGLNPYLDLGRLPALQ